MKHTQPEVQKIRQLTDRQLEVLEERCQGKQIEEIAESLHITKRTVQFHLRNIYNKLELEPTPSAAIRFGKLQEFCEALKHISGEETVQPEPELELEKHPTTTSSLVPTTAGTISKEPRHTGRFVRSQGGKSFTVENTGGAVPSDRVRALAISARGLWIGYFATDQHPFNGLGHYDGSKWSGRDLSSATTGDVNAVAVDQAGRVWIATEKDGIAVFDGKSWRRFTNRDGLPSDWTYGITIDEENNIWLATWEGVAVFDGDYWRVPYTVHNKTLFNNHVHAIAFDGSRDVWVGHINHGVSHYRGVDGTWYHHTIETSGLGGDQIRSIVVRQADTNSAESIWFAAADGGVSRFEQGEWTVYGVDDGLPSDDVRALAIDAYNRVWAATAGGVVYYDGQQWIVHSTINTLSIAFGPESAECPFDSDHVWIGTAGAGLMHFRLPFPHDAIDVIEVCFVSPGRERVCPALTTVDGTPAILATNPRNLPPHENTRIEVVVSARPPYQLRGDRGDSLWSIEETDADLYGAWPVIPVKGTIEPGQPFTFTDYDNRIKAPRLPSGEQQRRFSARWRVWMHSRYTGPAIHIDLTVQGHEAETGG